MICTDVMYRNLAKSSIGYTLYRKCLVMLSYQIEARAFERMCRVE